MKKHLSTILLFLIFIIGLSLLLYPSFSDWWNSMHQSRVIMDYVNLVQELDDDEYEHILEAARVYNESLLQRANGYTSTPEQKAQYPQLLNIGGNGVMGYVDVPSINVSLPLYHGTAESVLQVAIGHLDWSSLPVGGESTHCVVSGHRGLPRAKLFTNLDRLREGDLFYVRVLDELLTYQVDQILVVEPQDVDSLMIDKGKDYCTLFTCTPYGINTHRLLVRGHRVENPEEELAHHIISEAIVIKPVVVAPLVALPMLLVLLIWILIPKRRYNRRDDW
ncbi:MAG: class C sortase [Oscillospiraceae bacterium]|nr:class C sortase [Oscillospiraceae bacterium]